MKWSWKLGRFAGIDTYVHASFVLLVAWSAWASWSGAGTGLAVVMGVAFLLAVFASVLLHELGHALVARRYGIRTRRIILSPIGGIAQLEGMPRKPRQELAVALAGPAVNFVVAAGLWLLAPLFAGAPMLASLLVSLMLANLGLGLFNLVPAFPMDGGRALRALLAERMGSYRATEVAARVGKVAALLMGVAGLVWGPFMLVLVAAFVWFAANAEQQASRRAHLDPYADAPLDPVEVLGGRARRGAGWPWGAWRGAWRDARRGARRGFDSGRPVRTTSPNRPPVRVVVIHRNWF